MKNLYFSFADEDLDIVRQIEKSMKLWVRQNKILIWHRGLLNPGDDLRQTALKKIEEADIILVFLSRNYLSSDFPYDEELEKATELRGKKMATIIPVFLKPIRLNDNPLPDIAPIPSNRKALTSKEWPDFDHALSVFSNELSVVIEKEEKNQNANYQSNNSEEVTPKSGSESFQVGFSFASEDRPYVKKVAENLRQKGTSVFFDEFHQIDMWGKDLYQHLNEVYKSRCEYCVVFISKYYAKKLWTKHEFKSAQAKAFKENREYILPVRFDDTELPGLNETVGYLDASTLTPEELAALILKKLEKENRN